MIGEADSAVVCRRYPIIAGRHVRGTLARGGQGRTEPLELRRVEMLLVGILVREAVVRVRLAYHRSCSCEAGTGARGTIAES